MEIFNRTCRFSQFEYADLISKSAQQISISSTSASKFELIELGSGRACSLVITNYPGPAHTRAHRRTLPYISLRACTCTLHPPFSYSAVSDNHRRCIIFYQGIENFGQKLVFSSENNIFSEFRRRLGLIAVWHGRWRRCSLQIAAAQRRTASFGMANNA